MITAGTFLAGSPEDEVGRFVPDFEAQHEVTITRSFVIWSTEVTQRDFGDLMGYVPTYYTDDTCPDCPVDLATWWEAAAYCNALSDREELPLCYDCAGSGLGVVCEPRLEYQDPVECPGYRLPGQYEWEYAARAGTTTATYNGDLSETSAYQGPWGDHECVRDEVLDPIAWYCWNVGIDSRPQPVGQLVPNPWGLYDMLGNVFESCEVADRIDIFAKGGEYWTHPMAVRAAFNIPRIREYRGGGFRPVRSLGF
jgi:formylglycine-generating enzyme required for sulfatase activity